MSDSPPEEIMPIAMRIVMAPGITLEIRGNIARISINRPEALNALTRETIDELDDLLTRVEKDPEVKGLVFHSQANFAAGADIKGMVDCTEETALAFSFSDVFNRIPRLPFPTVAAIEGYALGGGLELALCCDLRVAAKTAKLGLPEINLGIFPGAGGTVRLTRLVGYAKAVEMILLGGRIDGGEAETIGLVNHCVEAEELLPFVDKWMERIAGKSRVAVSAALRAIRFGADEPDWEKAVTREAELWCGLFSSHDQKEGMRAFIEKRPPDFKDR